VTRHAKSNEKRDYFTVAAFFDYGWKIAPSVSVASRRQPPSAMADYCQHEIVQAVFHCAA
jgi:hypothetical protein